MELFSIRIQRTFQLVSTSLTERNTENVKLLRGLRRTALLVLPAALPGMNL